MNKKLLSNIVLITVVVTLSFSGVFSAIIEGTITDIKSGETLPGVTIMAKGTYYGDASDFAGRYKVAKIKGGTYNIEVRLIGYKPILKTGVKIEENETLNLDFEMTESALAVPDIVVLGEAPLMDIEQTESKTTLGADQIEQLVVEDVTDLIKQQAGVVSIGDDIHIRGGRSYENSYLVDGLSIQDPYTGGTAGLSVTAGAIEEFQVLTGGFNAEYGQAMSGVVQVKTKEGSVEKYSGRFSYKTDDFGLFKSSNFNSDVGELQLSGPVLFSRKTSFFMTGYSNLSDTYLPHTHDLYSSLFGKTQFTPRESNQYSTLAKITHRFNPTLKLIGTAKGSAEINQGYNSNDFENPNPEYTSYPYQFQNILENYNTRTRVSNQQSLMLSHSMSPRFFYELRLSRFFTQQRSAVGEKMWGDDHAEPIDILPINYIFIPDLDPNDGVDNSHYVTTTGDGFYDYGEGENWRDYYYEQYTLKLDGNLSIGQKHVAKAGFETNLQEIQMVDINKPGVGQTGLGLDHDIYKVHPNTGAIYIQDKVSSFGLIVNLGLRYDWWVPGKYIDRLVVDRQSEIVSDNLREAYLRDTFGLLGHRGKGHISPRIGISHPVLDNVMLFYSYGHFSKLPQPQRVYAKLSSVGTSSSYPLFGNPNLNPETTVSYELGIRYEVTTNDVLSVTAYYKDIFDYIASFSITQGGRFANQNFQMYFNLDYARARGIEIEYKKRASQLLNIILQGSYSVSTGKSSSPKDELLVAKGELEEKSIKENFLSWDRPLRLSADVSLFARKDEHYKLFGLPLPDNWNMYLRFFWQSGKRYTTYTRIEKEGEEPEYIKNNQEPYSETGIDWRWIDFSVKKHFEFSGLRYSLFVEVTNLTDYGNSKIINPLTGRAYEEGDEVLPSWNDPLYPDLNPTYPFPFDPARYLSPRNIKLGVLITW
ncbi:MAG: TonB-dependent receptor [candidate division Zixibacteria bacterium]|nr:TonB-dependent receptor [candidate division Zixibacteria bacterium]